jgi:hypothetical protein
MADGSTSTRSVTRQKEKKTSAEKGVIKAELASFMVLNRERLFIKKK